MQFHFKHTSRFILASLCMTGAACGLNGCKKLVEVDPPVNTITTDITFSTNAKANSAMAGIFSQMMNNNGSLVFSNGGASIYAGLSADELTNFSGTSGAEDYQFYTNALQPTTDASPRIIWLPAYKMIYGANGVIAGITASTYTQLDDSTRKVLTGEAKFVRAFCYFYLTNLYGDVPMPLSTNFNETSLIKRTPQADVYKQIVQDLLDAQGLLGTDYATAAGERIRPNKWAATALLARVYLYQQNWADAETQATAVIGNSQFGLVSNLDDVFLKNSTESIWQLQQNTAIVPYNGTQEAKNFVPLFRWSTFDPITKAVFSNVAIFSSSASLLVPAYYLTDKAVKSFEAGDKRRKQWTDSVPAPAAAPYNGIVYVYPVKYNVQVTTVNGAITQYYTVLRLAEQYLIRAEARAQQGANLSGAAADINALRTRAGLPPTTAASKTDLLTAVAHERQTELFAEWGHRWLDLKRTGQGNTVLSTLAWKQPWSDNDMLYPIPSSEIISDPNLSQNTGY